MKPDYLRGIIPPIVTPFREDESLDENALRREVRALSGQGVHGLAFGGSTGEGATLTDEELLAGIEIIKSEIGDDLPLLCGIIRNSTRSVILAGEKAKSAGADVLMITPTFYHGADADGNFRFYSEISEKIELPIIIYNVIQSNPIDADLMKHLSEIEHVAGIKQAYNGLHGLAEMLEVCGKRTLVFGAQDDLSHISYAMGAVGGICASMAMFPELSVAQWESVQRGDLPSAEAINKRLMPVWRLIGGDMRFPGRLKSLLNLLGRDVGVPRRPLALPGEDFINRLRQTLHENDFMTNP